MRQISAHRSWSTMQVYVSSEQIFASQFHAVRNTNIGNKTPWSRSLNCLRHRFMGADAFKYRVSADPLCNLFNSGNAFVSALRHNFSCPKFAREFLAGFVTTHRYNSLSAHLL